jgi:hypothetical protein
MLVLRIRLAIWRMILRVMLLILRIMLLILRIIVRNRRMVLVLGVLIRAGRKGICMAGVARVSWAREGSQGHGGSGTRDWLVLVIDAQSRQGVCGVVFLLILRREPVGHGKRRKMMVPITSINSTLMYSTYFAFFLSSIFAT